MNLPREVVKLDLSDSLAAKRDEFVLDEGTIYLDGNSLGPMPHSALRRLREVAEKEWGNDLIASWNKHGWIDLPTKVGEKIAKLIGAAPGQTIACDSISVNLFKLLCAALSLNSGRSLIVSQQDNFPTDLYMVEGLSDLLGENGCRLLKADEAELMESLDENVAVLLLTQVNFRSGSMFDIERVTRRAHDVGALVIWDLAHSAGAVPLQLDTWGVDFAVGCGYKYLNGGPGAPAFVYVAQRHQEKVNQPLRGWMGHANPFDFDASYAAASGIKRFLSGTPNILSLAALDGALEVFDGVDISLLREKSLGLARLFMDLLNSKPCLTALVPISPERDESRGSQLAYRHPDAYAISQALIAANVIVDFRSPDCLRFGFTPLYTRYADIFNAIQALEKIIVNREYQQVQFQRRNFVT